MLKRTPANAQGMRAALIAPCGMNCRLCHAYVRDKNTCPGCRGEDSLKSSKFCVTCPIKNCDRLVNGDAKYCFGCENYPCDRLKHLDKRYRTKYAMSMLENLENIRSLGIRRFVEKEKERWPCPECGELLCVHKPQCLACGHAWR